MKHKLKFYVTDCAPYKTLRLYLELNGDDIIPVCGIEYDLLSKLCCWGGFDKVGTRFRSWEFDTILFSEPLLKYIATRFGYEEETDVRAAWLR